MKKILLIISLFILLLLASCTYEYKYEEHSDNYNQIMNLLQQQCKAMRYENTTQLFEVYPYANDTIEYMEIKKLALQKFRTINTMRCEYDIEKIKYNLKKDKAELYLNGIITERIQGWPENRTLTAPDKEGKNDFTFAK